MMVILFRSRLTPAAGDDYNALAERMDAHARTFPGFIDVKEFRADDGERLTVVWWESADTLRAWATDAQHREAQRIGREKWYEHYTIEVAEIVRTREFTRPDSAGQP